MRRIDISNSHRILSPRVAFMVGSGADSIANIIPVSNVTSISTEPEIFGIGIYRDWSMVRTIREHGSFALCVPRWSQRDLVWKLASSYSKYPGDGIHAGKMAEFSDQLDTSWCSAGPVLVDSIARAECKIVRVVSDLGDHVWFHGEVVKAEVNPDCFGEDGSVIDVRPVMQVVGPVLAVPGETETMRYFD